MNDAIRQLRSEARHLTRGKVPKAIRYPVLRQNLLRLVWQTFPTRLTAQDGEAW
jgi:hypothetical protein